MTVRDHGFHPLRIARIVPETADAVSLVLDVPPDLRSSFAYRAGQFCTFRAEVGGTEVVRCYSMSSSPDVGDPFVTTVKRVPDGLMSNWMIDSLAAGDTTRSDFLYTQLTSGLFSYSPQTGLGSRTSPLKGTLPNYIQQFLNLQANAADSAQQVAQGQDVVVNTLQQKFNATSGVNIDAEMANLIALQNIYGANAHVMAVAQSMMQTLMQSQR